MHQGRRIAPKRPFFGYPQPLVGPVEAGTRSAARHNAAVREVQALVMDQGTAWSPSLPQIPGLTISRIAPRGFFVPIKRTALVWI
jgi:hypothetical protein